MWEEVEVEEFKAMNTKEEKDEYYLKWQNDTKRAFAWAPEIVKKHKITDNACFKEKAGVFNMCFFFLKIVISYRRTRNPPRRHEILKLNSFEPTSFTVRKQQEILDICLLDCEKKFKMECTVHEPPESCATEEMRLLFTTYTYRKFQGVDMDRTHKDSEDFTLTKELTQKQLAAPKPAKIKKEPSPKDDLRHALNDLVKQRGFLSAQIAIVGTFIENGELTDTLDSKKMKTGKEAVKEMNCAMNRAKDVVVEVIFFFRRMFSVLL